MAGSPYFHAMFINNMAEHDKQNIVIGGVSKQIFSIILEFLYSGRFDFFTSVVKENVFMETWE